jgi:hypothetical protein
MLVALKHLLDMDFAALRFIADILCFCVAATGAAKSIGIRPKENGSSPGQLRCNLS